MELALVLHDDGPTSNPDSVDPHISRPFSDERECSNGYFTFQELAVLYSYFRLELSINRMKMWWLVFTEIHVNDYTQKLADPWHLSNIPDLVAKL